MLVNMMSSSFLIVFIVTGLFACSSAQLYFVSLPQSTELQSTSSFLKLSDVASMINYIMGFSTSANLHWRGVKQMDIFHRPKANLFINIEVPEDVHFNINNFTAKYNIENIDQFDVESYQQNMQEVNELYAMHKSISVSFSANKQMQILKTVSHNAPDLSTLPSTLSQVHSRLHQSDVEVLKFIEDKCLENLRNAVVFFCGEVQTMLDITSAIENDLNTTDSIAPDFFYFSLSGLGQLVQTFGVHSCQVQRAVQLLHEIIPQVIKSFKNRYGENLLAEVLVANPNYRFLNEVHLRYVRSVEENVAKIGNMVMPNNPDYPVVANLVFWFMVVFSLSVLAAAYSIWHMDPGRDSIIYRMTTQRMKID